MAASSSRDPWFDNAKMALVTLVVVGHAWAPITQVAAAEYLYDFLYLWHMPAFVLVTGYLSRSFSYAPERMWQLVRTLVVPYFIFEAALGLFRYYVGGETDLENLFIDPHWPMWYLVAVLLWRLATPLFRSLSPTRAVTLAVAVSLSAGFYAGLTLDLARVLGFLPFFVLGLHLTPERLERLRTPMAGRSALGVFGIIAVAAALVDVVANSEWLYYSKLYSDFGADGPVGPVEALLIRAALLALGAAGAFAFLALVPRVRGWFTEMGAATMVVYLGHGFFQKAAEFAGVDSWVIAHPVVGFLVITAAALGVALLLAWQPVAHRLQAVVDPFARPEREIRAAVRLARTAEEAERVEAEGRELPRVHAGVR